MRLCIYVPASLELSASKSYRLSPPSRFTINLKLEDALEDWLQLTTLLMLYETVFPLSKTPRALNTDGMIYNDS